MLERLKEGLKSAVEKLLGAGIVDEALVKEFVRDLQRTLLQADVNVNLVLTISNEVETKALRETPPPGLSRKDHIVKILYDSLSGLMGKEASVEMPLNRTNKILMMGIQGSGKTTTVAKLARYYHKKGYKVGIICGDTFRPGALTQLRMLTQSMSIEVYGDEHSRDAVSAVSKGLQQLAQGKNIVIIDTAGRHKEEKGLLEEMREISKVVNPDLAILVIDGTIGQASYVQSEAFHKTVPVGGIIITKLDGAAKGGGALAATASTGASILFLGTGERIDDLEPFSPTRFVGRLLGMGDIQALLDRAKEIEAEGDEKGMRRIMAGKMTINDFYRQIEQVKKFGSLKKMIELIPGLSGVAQTDEIDKLDEKLKRWKVIIQSMTPEEKENPEILNASRIKRAGRGSGIDEKEVKDMLTRFRESKRLLKSTKGRSLQQLMRRLAIK